MLTLKQRGELHHALNIQRVRVMAHIAPLKRRADFAAKDTVFVGLHLGRITRVKVERRLFGAQRANVAGEQPVHRPAKIVERNRILHAERRHLRERVHAGIGAARAGYFDRLARDLACYFLQNALNGRQSRLDLPAVIIRPIVGDLDFNSSHQRTAEKPL